MNEQLEQKNIIISNVEMTNWGFKITDEKGLKYNISETKKDGAPTIAYKTLAELPKYGIGLNKCFKFATVPNSQGGQSRYVRIITEPETSGQPTTYVSPKITTAKPVIIEKEATDWDKISWGKCKHAYLVEAFKHLIGLGSVSVLEDVKKELWEKKAEQWADMSMRRLSDIKADDEISVENIPFD